MMLVKDAKSLLLFHSKYDTNCNRKSRKATTQHSQLPSAVPWKKAVLLQKNGWNLHSGFLAQDSIFLQGNHLRWVDCSTTVEYRMVKKRSTVHCCVFRHSKMLCVQFLLPSPVVHVGHVALFRGIVQLFVWFCIPDFPNLVLPINVLGEVEESGHITIGWQSARCLN